jgi:hypothetical protein
VRTGRRGPCGAWELRRRLKGTARRARHSEAPPPPPASRMTRRAGRGGRWGGWVGSRAPGSQILAQRAPRSAQIRPLLFRARGVDLPGLPALAAGASRPLESLCPPAGGVRRVGLPLQPTNPRRGATLTRLLSVWAHRKGRAGGGLPAPQDPLERGRRPLLCPACRVWLWWDGSQSTPPGRDA